MKALIIALALSSASAFATNVKCNIANLKDAQACMDSVALKHEEYNLPNIGSASTQKEILKKVLTSTGRKVKPALNGADYVGVMLEKGDEWILYYYAMKKGTSTSLTLVGEINLVDITDELINPLTVPELILGDRYKKFDTEDRGWLQDYLDLE